MTMIVGSITKCNETEGPSSMVIANDFFGRERS